jgi:hypothetical protein
MENFGHLRAKIVYSGQLSNGTVITKTVFTAPFGGVLADGNGVERSQPLIAGGHGDGEFNENEDFTGFSYGDSTQQNQLINSGDENNFPSNFDTGVLIDQDQGWFALPFIGDPSVGQINDNGLTRTPRKIYKNSTGDDYVVYFLDEYYVKMIYFTVNSGVYEKTGEYFFKHRESIGLPNSYIDINNFKNKTVNYTDGLENRDAGNLDPGETVNYRISYIFYKISEDTGGDMMDDPANSGDGGLDVEMGDNLVLSVFKDDYTVGFVKKSIQTALESYYGEGSVGFDENEGFGDINGNNTEITLSSSDSNSPFSNAGKELLAIEKWYNGGWSPNSMGTNVVVGFSGTGLTTQNAPVLKYNDVLYPPLEVATPANWGGVTIDGGFQIVRYSVSGLAIDTDLFADETTTLTLSFYDPDTITTELTVPAYSQTPSPSLQLSNINTIPNGVTKDFYDRAKVWNSGTLIIEGELQLSNGALFTNTGYIIIKPGGKITLCEGDEIPSNERYLGFVMDGREENNVPRGIILVEGSENPSIELENKRHITLYSDSNLINTTTGDFRLENATNNIIYKGDGTPTPPAYNHSTWQDTTIS